MPGPSTSPKVFCVGQTLCSRPKLIWILYWSQTFCARQKNDLSHEDQAFVLAENKNRSTLFMDCLFNDLHKTAFNETLSGDISR